MSVTPNTITYAKAYINSQKELLRMFRTDLICKDLLKEASNIMGKTVAYDEISFTSYVMGTYDRANGLTTKPFTFDRKEKTLTQDRGDTLELDTMDKKEAQIADGLMGVYNVYRIKVSVPTVDTYAFNALAGAGNSNVVVHNSVTSSNILSAILADRKELTKKRIKAEECILYISSTDKALLDEACLGKGFITVGNWNGNIDTDVEIFKGMKVTEVPDDELPENVHWIIVHPLAASVLPVLALAEVYDRVPGFPGKAQIDVRDYFDAWVNPNGGLDGIVTSLSALRNPKLPASATFDTSLSVEITGIEAGAKVYYTLDGSTPTSASTEYTAPIALSATKTVKAIAIKGSDSSAVASATYTKN